MEGRSSQLKKIVFTIFAACVLAPAGAGTGLYMGPYFPSPQPRNITVHQDTVAYLPCTVSQLGDKSVSWVRQRDADILTVDRYTFVRDDRLTVHFTPDTGTWTLVIKYVQERDAGTYECQISTEPKMSMLVHLNVIVPQVEITGAVDKYVRSGSTARLECKVSSTVQLPDYIFWYHSGSRLLEYDHPRVKITVARRGGQGSEMSITSTLVLTDARPSDAGNYTCLPSNLHNATTILHVLNDEHPAAMQTGAAMLTDPPNIWGILLVVALALLFVQAHPHLAHTNLPPPALTLQDASEDAAEGSERTASSDQTFADVDARLCFSDIPSKTQNSCGFARLQLHGIEDGVVMQTHEDRRRESGQGHVDSPSDAALTRPRAVELIWRLFRGSQTDPHALKGGGTRVATPRETLEKRCPPTLADIRGASSSPAGDRNESSAAVVGPRDFMASRTGTSPKQTLLR
ncbi:fibroblast growth factor receptor-like 1 [Penaeus japonicus]|uniref:fibroblast growth factor receptor-like 1 n=1 Tax=Penaeus japonicus TaxID=27405 RepID=UPI001C714006|nr:fibroblast growth factor receptor-like 1 [Penaeus japonicus]